MATTPAPRAGTLGILLANAGLGPNGLRSSRGCRSLTRTVATIRDVMLDGYRTVIRCKRYGRRDDAANNPGEFDHPRSHARRQYRGGFSGASYT
jgi:hypothetical protein